MGNGRLDDGYRAFSALWKRDPFLLKRNRTRLGFDSETGSRMRRCRRPDTRNKPVEGSSRNDKVPGVGGGIVCGRIVRRFRLDPEGRVKNSRTRGCRWRGSQGSPTTDLRMACRTRQGLLFCGCKMLPCNQRCFGRRKILLRRAQSRGVWTCLEENCTLRKVVRVIIRRSGFVCIPINLKLKSNRALNTHLKP